MAARMRLRREGKRKQPSYRVVVADVRAPRDGAYIEDLGFYQPLNEPSRISINRDRALYWLHQGVKPSDQVRKLLQIVGVWEAFEAGEPGGGSGDGARITVGGASGPSDTPDTAEAGN